MAHQTVFIIVLAWNHWEDTRETLTSFQNDNYPKKELIVVDNGSTDGTSDLVAKEFPSIVTIRSDTNLGVSGGYNLGIKYAMDKGAELILIANNDIATDEQMITRLVAAIDQSPNAGIAMPKIYHYYGNRNRLWCTGAYWRRFPPTVKMANLNRHDQDFGLNPVSIEFAPSCVLLLTTKLIKDIGLFDSKYFFYFDDWDFSKRAKQNGFEIFFVPTAVMWHKVSISTQKTDKPEQWWQKMGYSAALYYSRYHSKVQAITFFVWFMVREVFKGKPIHSIGFIKGVDEYRKTQKLSMTSTAGVNQKPC